MTSSERHSGTVTFLFTDIEGSTALLKRLGREQYGEVLGRQSALLREAFAANGGEEIDNQGDSFFAAFRSARDALLAAVTIQRSLSDHEWPDGVEVRVRIGIHSGEAAAAGDRYVGISVHRAARIGAIAHGGQVLVSDSTRTLVEDDLPPGVYMRDLGVYRLKDIDRPERVSQLVTEGLPSEFPPLRGAEPVKSRPLLRRRSALAAALVGVVAAAVSIPIFALGGGGTSSSSSLATVGADSVGAFDASDGQRIASTEVGAPPGAIAAQGGSVWIANPDGGTVTRIETASGLRQTIPVGNDPSAVAIGGGFVWVANALSGSVSKVDPNANGGSGAVVDTIPVGNGPAGVVFAEGRLWVANATDRTVMEFVPGAHVPLKTIGVVGGTDAITAGFGFLWVASSGGNSVTRIALGSGTTLPPIGVGSGPLAIAAGDGAVWTANGLDGTVSRIDPADGTVSGISIGGTPAGIAAGGDTVWVSDSRAGAIARMETSGIAQVVKTGNQPQEIAISGRSLYVSVEASGRSHRGGTLTVFSADPNGFGSIDPAVEYLYDDQTAIIMTNDGLLAYQRVGGAGGTRLVPDLATSIPTPTDSGRTYTFQVRAGIHYSTGAVVRPADFRRAIERSLSLYYRSGATQGFLYTGIVGASSCKSRARPCDLSKGIVVDPSVRTVTFHLTEPDPYFLDYLALPPSYAVPSDTPVDARLPLPATGPYMFKSFTKRGAVLVRNRRFREWFAAAQPVGYPDRIVWRFGTQPAGQVASVSADKADFASGVPPDQISTLRRNGHGSQLHGNSTFFTIYLLLNSTTAPFDDVRVRRAVNLAVDRSRLVALTRSAYGGRPTCQVTPPNLAGYVRYCPYPLDLARARRLVAASGTAGTTVVLWTLAEPDHPGGPLAAYVASVLRSLGYKTRVKTFTDRGAYYSGLQDPRQRFDLAWSGWIPTFPSAADVLYPLFSCPSFRPRAKDWSNFGRFCSPPIDREIARALRLEIGDPQAAGALWGRVDHDLADQAAAMPFAIGQNFDLVSIRVGNYQRNPFWGPLFDQMWVK